MADVYIREGDHGVAIRDVLRDAAGDPVDITGAAIKFQMTAIEGGTLKIDAVASNDQNGNGDDGSLGHVSYVVQAADSDAAGDYLGAWLVQGAGDSFVQTYPNSGWLLVSVTADPPETLRAYVSLAEAKQTKTLLKTDHADRALEIALEAASDALDVMYGGPWRPGAADEVRYFTPAVDRWVRIDPLLVVNEVAIDELEGYAWPTVLAQGTDYALDPIGAGALPSGSGEPWRKLTLLRGSSAAARLPVYADAVRVTGTFGWTTPPAGVKAATTILAARVLARMRQHPFGIIQAGVEGTAEHARSLAYDPEIKAVMRGLGRPKRLVV